jgi:ketosteroid isomerase-like protein
MAVRFRDRHQWVGFQLATARLDKSAKAIPFNLRVTEVFRREGGEWKLVHRHADTLVSEPEEHKK